MGAGGEIDDKLFSEAADPAGPASAYSLDIVSHE